MRGRTRLALGALGGVLVTAGLLGAEGFYAAGRDYLPADSAPPVAGTFHPDGSDVAGGVPAYRLVLLGDSTAAGVGASSTATTVGGLLARRLAAVRGTPVRLSSVAVSGARSADLRVQVDRALAGGADAALVLVGANDATHGTRLRDVDDDLGAAVRRLRSAGLPVVVGTCPDLGAARALPRPLRSVVAWRGRAVAAAERAAVERAGGTAVDLAARTGPAFRADPATLAADSWHPSDRGYALWAGALAPQLSEGSG